MKNIIFSIFLTLLIVGLFFTSFALGAMDGCADAGYDTFAIGEYGVYCLHSEQLRNTPINSGDL